MMLVLYLTLPQILPLAILKTRSIAERNCCSASFLTQFRTMYVNRKSVVHIVKSIMSWFLEPISVYESVVMTLI